ncbi:MAG: hydrolase [Sphingomonadales bacterium]|nr:hydrolase [Sphingomonadales bacterium]
MTFSIPAATLIVYRRRAALSEILFVERAGTMAFAAGAIVFPGGRVDPGDRMLAERFPEFDPDDAAARIAAIRETIEEAGTAVGLAGATDAATVGKLRAHLHDGMVFADALAALRIELRPELLVPFSRWCPHAPERRSFDTRFYLAEALDDALRATVDETENVRLFWATAQQVLDDADAGRVKVIFPTRRNLERLAQFADFAEAQAHATKFAPEKIVPWVEDRDGVPTLCIPEDRGYPIWAEPLAEVRRG